METDARMTIEQVAERCAEVLRNKPSGLFSDFDGTLSEVAPTPGEAVAYEGAQDALLRVAKMVDAAGIITGRAVADVRSKLDADHLLVVGNHGLEWFENGEHIDHEAGVAAERAITEALDVIERRLSEQVSTEHMIWENKRLTASIHFRNVDDPVAVGMALLPIVEEEGKARGLKVSSGKMLFELRPDVVISKGTALERLVTTRGLQGAIFFGDDVTDVDGFRSLHEIRERDGVETLAIAIRSKDVHPTVISESDMVLEGVADTVRVLDKIAELLSKDSR